MVIITGAASGIGAACATRFLHEGFRVCTTDNDKTPLDLITDRLNKEGYQSNLLPINMDVCSREEIEQTSQTILNKWKSIDILINCAGIFASKPFNETEADLFKKIMDVNLFGTFNVCQIISQIMKDNGGGKIINLSSISALQGALNASAYAASKAGVIALSKTMARELAQNNIQVNIVTPGFIDTPMAEPYIKTLKVITSMRVPSKRMGDSWEVADVIYGLATCKAKYLIGSQIVIDGGLTLG